MKDIPEGFIRRKTSTIPFGYKEHETDEDLLEDAGMMVEIIE